MLLNLSIKNFAIVSFVEIDWQQGMTTITGETGAGKSIAIDALGLCLGERATTNTVRPGSQKAELSAHFDIANNDKAIAWLAAHDLTQDGECLIRRVITAEGRSKAYINGSAVPLAQLKALGQFLINIHGQHDHQLLIKSHEQRKLLDGYAGHQNLLEKLKSQQKQWQQLQLEFKLLEQNHQQRQAQQQLLQYQVKELDEFNLQEQEFPQLENDYKRHSNSQQLLTLSEQCVKQLDNSEQFSMLSLLQKCSDDITELAELDSNASELAQLVNEARIQLEEASNDLIHYQQSIDIDPQAYALIEERYSTALQLARKHQVAPENLVSFHANLSQQLTTLQQDDDRLLNMANELEQCQSKYLDIAKKLSKSRAKAAKSLQQRITTSIQQLNMPDACFELSICPKQQTTPSEFGIDEIEFLVSMNPGQPLEALHKVASGGELSRISLAIQVILAERVVTPTLIFDEVDVGISGPTAAMVGQQLQLLGENTQVICVTHLPQVASKGHQQLFVTKLTDGKHTQTSVSMLSKESREREIARLLAGDSITESSLANARDMLAS
ncbi:DNA repair protein RecN [Thalassomonas sp. M1454]|uniref:DNA repair protein RecN n=1 Tax=Thalassomonas sp. M1454 TaxID=2594477 RepID=UPI001180E517|nr:DNA repair protein RecN [Thalassomonas sp. M1454]TRX57294.1 DNA repair protein RecN [Thalassomonas sp. M1454]